MGEKYSLIYIIILIFEYMVEECYEIVYVFC